MHRLAFPLLGLLGLSALAGCDSSGPSPRTTSTAFAAAAPPSDPAINTGDTYVMATVSIDMDATLQSSTPMFDATTGQQSQTMVLDRAPMRFAIEAGYDASGAFVFNQYALDLVGDPLTSLVDEARTISVHGGRFEFLDGQGQSLAGTGDGAGPSLRTVFDAYGSEQLQLLNEILLDEPPQEGDASSLNGSTSTVTEVVETGETIEVHATATSSDPADPPIS